MGNMERIEPDKLLEEVRAFRLDNVLTWKFFAGLVGMSEAGLWKIAHGKTAASELTEHKIRKAIDGFGLKSEEVAESVEPECGPI
tara:strand:- start:10062 stop:10316 length:255 start_codon:yes stop_codon:yes gene_type:complete